MTDPVLKIDIKIEASGWTDLVPQLEQTISAPAEAAVAACLYDRRDTELSVLMTSDERMAALNQEWRGKDGATNVLSFPGDLHGPGPLVLGDIALALETVRVEADKSGIPVADHLVHLVVHGVLHLLGHDHETESEAQRMETLETEVLRSLGIPDPHGANREELFEVGA